MRLLLAATAFLAAGQARAQTFETFQKYCLESGDEPAQMLLAARGAGWQTDEGNASLPEDMQLTLLSWPSPEAHDNGMLMIGHMASPTGIPTPYCSVLGGETEHELASRVTEWAGFEPGKSGQGNETWVYTVSESGPVAQPDLVGADDAKLVAAARSRGTVHAIQVRRARAGPFLFRISVAPDATSTSTH